MAIQLTTLLSGNKTFLLVYTIPLLLSALLVTFAGAFFTFDRTRTFPPPADCAPSLPGSYNDKSKIKIFKPFQLNGGIGGIAVGFIFGLYISTLLALVFSNKARSPLGSIPFFVIWLLVALVTSLVGGRWRIAALTFMGITAGISLSLFLCIITHSSLSSRIAIVSVITPLMALTTFVPPAITATRQTVFAHSIARIAFACTGSFSVTMAIALLTGSIKYHSWANVWDRLWLFSSSEWNTSTEKGMDALFCFLWLLGTASDWGLKRYFGSNHDETWDMYLAEYSAVFPNSKDRAGNFRPMHSRWSRFLRRFHLTSAQSTGSREILLTPELEKTEYTPILEAPFVHGHIPDISQKESTDTSFARPLSCVPTFIKGQNESIGQKELLKKKDALTNGGFQSIYVETTSQEELKNLARQPTCLQKKRISKARTQSRHATGHGRVRLEFRPKDGFSSESDDDSESIDTLKTPLDTPLKSIPYRFPLVHTSSSSTSLSGTTVNVSTNSGHAPANSEFSDIIDIDAEKTRLVAMRASFGGANSSSTRINTTLDYSDVEEDVTTGYTRTSSPVRDAPGWKPNFLKQLDASSIGPHSPESQDNPTSCSPVNAMMLTPSLFTAIERLAKAQADLSAASCEDVSVSSPQQVRATLQGQTTTNVSGLPLTQNR